eukprot:6213959-Pleurochrysis_carterae.AAC.1
MASSLKKIGDELFKLAENRAKGSKGPARTLEALLRGYGKRDDGLISCSELGTALSRMLPYVDDGAGDLLFEWALSIGAGRADDDVLLDAQDDSDETGHMLVDTRQLSSAIASGEPLVMRKPVRIQSTHLHAQRGDGADTAPRAAAHGGVHVVRTTGPLPQFRHPWDPPAEKKHAKPPAQPLAMPNFGGTSLLYPLHTTRPCLPLDSSGKDSTDRVV